MNTTTNTRGVSEAMVTHQAAAEALDSLDDYARMGTGVDAHGPRGVLKRYIAQQSATLRQNPERGVTEAMVERALIRYAMLKDQAVWPDAYSDDELEMERRDMRAALEAALSAEPANNYRDAYEGAREDLLDWKGRAQRAEATLRSLGYQGVDASEPPAQPADSKVIGDDSQIKPGERVPEGWVLVPRKPTEVMAVAATKALVKFKPETVYGHPVMVTAREVYAAMLSASPAPSPARVDGGEG